ncbi:TRAP transporter small permease [Plastorhodobacter daqingensis]|uniref:TRAP transporter small permease protein n=1 Tax=Plastorhodobacter daqingensis TaxID=1387281 RepID=A0ABW2UHQ4_9RHOB
MLARLDRAADLLIRLCAGLGTIGLFVVVVVILRDVVGRNMMQPLAGAQDIAQMGMVIIVFGGMALCDRRGGHVAVDVFERVFPGWLNRWADILSAFLGAAIFLGIAWTVYDSSRISQMLNLSTNVIRLPKAQFQWALCGFALVTAAGMLLRALVLLAARPGARA